MEEKRLVCERAHIVLGTPAGKKIRIVIIIIIIAEHTREPVEVGGGGFQSSQSHVRLNPHGGGFMCNKTLLPLGGSYTVVSIFSMISIMDLEGESREQSS